MADEVVKGNKKYTSGNSAYNAQEFHVRNIIMQHVNTATPVIVTAAQAGGAGEAAGWVTVKPLVAQIDGFGNTVPPVELFKLPYFRYQGGVAAVVIDPVPGDIGLAVFCKSDCSNIQQEQSEPVQPGSFRKFSQSDGFYLGGFLNKAPTTYVELKQSGEIVITAPGGLTINGNITVNGSQTLTGDCIAAGISLDNHIHTGDSGGTTSPPIG